MHDETMLRSGLTRRQVLERSALAGGAVLAAQSLGAVAAFAQTSPPPPPPEEPPPTGALPSNFQLVVGFLGGTYGVKYDAGDNPPWDGIGSGTLCSFTTPFVGPTDALIQELLTNAQVTIGSDADGHLAYVVSLPSTITFIEGRSKDGSCQAFPGDTEQCGAHVEPMSDGTLVFTACDH